MVLPLSYLRSGMDQSSKLPNVYKNQGQERMPTNDTNSKRIKVIERKREREKEKKRKRERKKETEKPRDRERKRQRGRERVR